MANKGVPQKTHQHNQNPELGPLTQQQKDPSKGQVGDTPVKPEKNKEGIIVLNRGIYWGFALLE